MFSVSHIGAEDDCGWIVQKYGGTSVGSSERIKQIVSIVSNSLQSNHIAVVCSAMSPTDKSKGTTSLLLKSVQALNEGINYQIYVEQVRAYHISEANNALHDSKYLEEALNYIESSCNKLAEFLDALDIISEISPTSKDIVVSYGERLSCKLVSLILNNNNIPSVYIGLESLMERSKKVGYPITLNQQFYDKTGRQMASLVFEECSRLGYPKTKVVPVVTGYFGFVPGSLLSAIGRGYSDLCAALLSAGVFAEELQIWKEVDGIFTADPRKIKTATLVKEISPDEAAELTYYGSEVIHPFTMDQVIRNAIPIRIKNTFNPSGCGTLIVPEESPKSPISTERRGPTAVTIKDNIILMNIRSNQKSSAHGFLSRIFHVLDKQEITVDLISTSQVHVTLAIPEDPEMDLPKAVEELEVFGHVTISHKQCILSIVGRQMRRSVGVAGQMFNRLAASGTNIEMISQGASEINISCVVHEIDALKALAATHELINRNIK
eukprot:NODE_69_length_23719_cov_0.556689.p5 type:complete len:493 gc:universal NODE_69_length_23719_cov_0.556689:12570-14048(+)